MKITVRPSAVKADELIVQIDEPESEIFFQMIDRIRFDSRYKEFTDLICLMDKFISPIEDVMADLEFYDLPKKSVAQPKANAKKQRILDQFKTYKLQQASPGVIARIESFEDNVGTQPCPRGVKRLPYSELRIGWCFVIPFHETKEKNLRNKVSLRNKGSVKQFIVIKHNEFQCYEVARVK